MSTYMVGPGIRFNDFVFSEPAPLTNWTAPKFAGLFVVLAGDTSWAPRPFQPLYFGEFGNNARNLLPPDTIRLPLNGRPLFISVLPLPFSSSAQRCEVCNQLAWAYNPVCQGSAAPNPNELVRKLDELEKRHEEQTTQFRLLLANMNRLFEPQPERPRRPIGFLPQPAD
jgi:hypothetical protein